MLACGACVILDTGIVTVAYHNAFMASALATVLLGACGATDNALAEPTAPVLVDTTPKSLPSLQLYIPGEVMRFELRFRKVVVGRAALTVGEPGVLDGRPTFIVRSGLETVGVGKLIQDIRDDVTSWLDMEKGRTVRQRAEMLFGEQDMLFNIRCAGRWVFIEIVRRGPKYQGLRKRFARTQRQYRVPAGEVAFDTHAVLGALRAWDGKPGERLYFYTVSGNRIWQTELKLAGTETRYVALGQYPALRFEGTSRRVTYKMEPDPRSEPRAFTLWLSDDDDRLPLLIEGHTDFGKAAIELVDYHKKP